jgi:hypothetical protein
MILPKWAIIILFLELLNVGDLVPRPNGQCTVVAGSNFDRNILLMKHQQV